MTNRFQRRPNQDGRHTPNLWPVWLVAPGALLLVALAAYGLYHGAELLLDSENTGKGKKPVPVQDVITTTVTVLTLAGAVLAALYAYRKQLLDEGTSHRADATQLTERYAKAAEQLGHEQAAVRLAGVYAMARLADDWPEQRQVCVDVLCAYLRMPYEADLNEPGFRHGDREVRLSIIRIMRSHLQDPADTTTWCGHTLDFTGAIFDGGDFSGAIFSGGEVSFRGARFSGGEVSFDTTTFSGAKVSFDTANFSGSQVSFFDTKFSDGQVNFKSARFSGSRVNFYAATFSGATVSFSSARFDGGRVDFSGARFNGGQVAFSGARFPGGEVGFSSARFAGGRVVFSGARFDGGQVAFSNAKFDGGAVNFGSAWFSDGRVTFSSATFSGGTVNFGSATHSGGEVSFRGSRVAAAATIQWGPFVPVHVNHS
ncbi:pentapeptide repeat-containing protein [Streptomyces sp. NPDC049916]|uniref:pentapeptide repeat-containing protein n=1 Tax=Streptomyces sp. NPDC049916 TaxID=3155156 RepID=UPI003445A3F5